MLGAAIALGALIGAPTPGVWDVPAGCPDRAAFDRRLQRYAVGATVDPGEIAVRITATADGYLLELTTGERPRRLSAQDCGKLVDAAALIVAVGLDPVATAAAVATSETVHRSGPASAGTSGPEPETVHRSGPASAGTSGSESETESGLLPVAVDEEPEEPARSPPAEPSRLQGLLRAELAFGGPILPGIGVGAGGAVGLRGRDAPWRVEVHGAYWFPRSVDVSGIDAAARFTLAEGGARGCWEPRLRTVSFLVCGGIEAGALRGEGLGTGVVHRTQVQPWVAVAASPGIVWAPVPAFGLFARADVLVSLYRPGFHFEGIETLHRAGIAAGRGVFGLEVRFP